MPGKSRSGGRNLYCPFHAKQEIQVYDSKAVSREVLGPFDDFKSACAINRALGKLFTVTIEDRIPVRNAAVLAFIAQLMLRTLHPLRNEIIEAGGQHGMDAILRDVFALLGNELDKDQPPPPGKVKPHWREEIEESLAVLRRAGFALPTALGGKAEETDGEDDGIDDSDNDDNDGVDDSEDADEARAEA